ncbi:hypothetical protein C3492_24855 [Streptomyces sp. Ru62]|uniref:hypothetical protein n=1 Tax=Streptomyces sp. Ru62 TaxID=2080745 RepID=UPI000CDE2219|nr:hypothetical protein [Streptomyces sp. Ru62]POX60918.1 hypothetical protein C3492_24855 [Streptomyces sp. Ru62]
MSSDQSTAGEPPDNAPARPDLDESGPKKRFEQANAWIGTLVGVVALGLSVHNLLALQREPAVDVALPHIVRVAQGKDTWLYIQPTLSTRVKTDRVEVITQIDLQLRPTRAGTERPAAFFWDETGSYSYSASAHQLTYQRVADPSPLLVSQSTPQQPLLLLNAVRWNFAEGRYEGELVFRRASGRKSLRKSFCLTISKNAVETMRSAGQYQHHDFRNDVPGSDPEKTGCYVLSPV